MCKQPAKGAKPKNPRKKPKCQRCNARGNLKTAPKQKKISNARVLLRANDVRGVQMIDVRGGRLKINQQA
jgi:hypothetical protein